MDLTRRWFVFGSAAAVALAALPVTIAEPIRAPSGVNYLSRRISHLTAYFDADPNVNAPVRVEMLRGDTCLWSCWFHARGVLSWWSDPLSDFYLSKDCVFSVMLDSPPAKSDFLVHLDCRDKIDDGDLVPVLETYRFPKGVGAPLVATHCCDINDIQRFESRRSVARA